MTRRDLIALLGSTAVSWPLAARAQQLSGPRRVGVLMDTDESNTEGQARIRAFTHGLHALGWNEGSSLLLDVRWAAGNTDRSRAYATELVGLKPDVVFAFGNAQIRPLSQVARTIPIVFVGASDPVGAGYAESFARPGSNITGFTLFEASMAGKWLAVLKELMPALARATIMVNPETGMRQGKFYLPAFESAASTLMIERRTAVVRNASEIEAAIATIGQQRDAGLIVAPDGFAQAHDAFIVGLAAQHRVPAVYGPANFAKLGGLLSYGPHVDAVCRQAASYIDRILRGEQAARLPIQAPTTFDLVLKLTTAKALGLDVPATLLARADEVIE